MIQIIVEKYVKKEKQIEFFNIVKKLVDKSRNEYGNISYNLCIHPDDEEKILFVEQWKSRKYVKNIHCNTEHVLQIVPTLEKFYFKPGTEVWLDVIDI